MRGSEEDDQGGHRKVDGEKEGERGEGRRGRYREVGGERGARGKHLIVQISHKCRRGTAVILAFFHCWKLLYFQ